MSFRCLLACNGSPFFVVTLSFSLSVIVSSFD